MKKLLLLALGLALPAFAQNITVQKTPATSSPANELTAASRVQVVPTGGSITTSGSGVIAATSIIPGGSVPWTTITGTPTTLSGYGVTNTLTTTAPLTGTGLLSANLTIAMPAATGSVNGYLTSADWTTFNAKQPAGNYITALTGDVTAAGPGSAAATLATVNSNTGTFASVTVNGKGLVTAAAALSGDITTSGSVSTLATVASAGTTGSSTAIPVITINAKGLTTSISTAAVVAPAGTLTGTTLAANVVTSSLTTVGTIGSGTWQGTVVAGLYGGTGVANNGKTITLGGNLTTSGAFATTLTATATTSITMPTTGTLATLAGSEALTNKTYNGNTWTSGTGTLTLGAGKVATISNTLTFTGTDGSSVAFGTGGTVLYSGGAYVSSITGTANEITASAATGAVTLSIPSAVTFTGKTITGGTYASGAFNGTLGATTPSTIAATSATATGSFTSTAGSAQYILSPGSVVWHLTASNTAITLRDNTGGTDAISWNRISGLTSITNALTMSGTLTGASSLVGTNSVTAAASTNLVLTGGSSGDILTIAQGSATASTFQNSLYLTLAGSTAAQLRLSRAGNLGIQFFDTAGTHYNWLVGSQYNVSDAFEITASSATGGTTFSTPLFKIAGATGVTAITSATASTSTSTGALVLSGASAGLGVAGNIWGGGTLNITGQTNLGSVLTFSPSVTLTMSTNVIDQSGGANPHYGINSTGGIAASIWAADVVGGMIIQTGSAHSIFVRVNSTLALTLANSTLNATFASTTEATTGGAGSLTTAGGIYAAKKLITASTLTTAAGVAYDFGAAAVAVAVASTHKAAVIIGGTTYYMLLTNIP